LCDGDEISERESRRYWRRSLPNSSNGIAQLAELDPRDARYAALVRRAAAEAGLLVECFFNPASAYEEA